MAKLLMLQYFFKSIKLCISGTRCLCYIERFRCHLAFVELENELLPLVNHHSLRMFVHPSICTCLSISGSQDGWKLSQLPLDEMRATPWTGCQSIAGLKFSCFNLVKKHRKDFDLKITDMLQDKFIIYCRIHLKKIIRQF